MKSTRLFIYLSIISGILILYYIKLISLNKQINQYFFWIFIGFLIFNYGMIILKGSVKEILVSSIIFSILTKFIVPFRNPPGILFEEWGYIWQTVTNYTLNNGYFTTIHSNLGAFGSYSSYPTTVILLTFIKLITKIDFAFLMKFFMPVLFSIVAIPLYYHFLRDGLEFEPRNAAIGTVFFNSCFTLIQIPFFRLYRDGLHIVYFWVICINKIEIK